MFIKYYNIILKEKTFSGAHIIQLTDSLNIRHITPPQSPTAQVTCYALNPSDGSPWREKIERGVEHFVDLSDLCGTPCITSLGNMGGSVNDDDDAPPAAAMGSGGNPVASSGSGGDLAAAMRINSDGLHIAIDLGGFTSRSQPGVFALRPAPVQVRTVISEATPEEI